MEKKYVVTDEEVLRRLREECQPLGQQKAFAQRAGCSSAAISYLLSDTRPMTTVHRVNSIPEKISAELGFKRVWTLKKG